MIIRLGFLLSKFMKGDLGMTWALKNYAFKVSSPKLTLSLGYSKIVMYMDNKLM